METYTSIVHFMQSGGFFMYPIALVFAVGLAVAIERYVYLSKTSVSNQALWKKITPFIQAGKFSEAASLTSKSNAAIGSILTYGLGPELAHLANGMVRIGWKVPLVGSWALNMPNFIDNAGPNAEGTRMPQTFILNISHF